LVALALHLKTLGQEVRLCVPPDFRAWIESLGISVTPIGPHVRAYAVSRPTSAAPPAPVTPEQVQQIVNATVATQFETITAAAHDCDVIVAATALQVAARSVAEKMGIPYVFAAYSPNVLPSPRHPPPPMPGEPPPSTTDNRELWARATARFNDLFGAALNAHRASLGLAPVSDAHRHMLTDRPWLAADPTLGPWPDRADEGVFPTGAWILTDERALPKEIEKFLDSGGPPIYFGFGSNRAREGVGQLILEAARALGRRAIVSRGWFDASLVAEAGDCLSIGDVNVHALFRRVAAIVHHGGAGTTTAAALAGAPQVVVPDHYDQLYWAHRVDSLGIGAALAACAPTADSLTGALERALERDIVTRARTVRDLIRLDGAQVAAERLIAP
jgi:vancomycin aglycone glucosyltransferase